MSMSKLDKMGCIFVGGGGVLRVFDRGGKFMFEGLLGPKDMYVYKMLVPHRNRDPDKVKRGCLGVLESWERSRASLTAHNGEVITRLSIR